MLSGLRRDLNAVFFPERIGRLHGRRKARELPHQKGPVIVIQFLRGPIHQELSGLVMFRASNERVAIRDMEFAVVAAVWNDRTECAPCCHPACCFPRKRALQATEDMSRRHTFPARKLHRTSRLTHAAVCSRTRIFDQRYSMHTESPAFWLPARRVPVP